MRSSSKRLAAALLAGTALVAAGLWQAKAQQTAPADFIIAGGMVYDGSDNPARVMDVVIAGDKIAYVGYDAAKKFTAKRTFDATGKIVSPGFIDGHSHPDRWLNSADPAMRNQIPWLTQGETTLLFGVEGSGTYKINEMKAAYEKSGIGANLVPLVGYGVLRGANGILGQDSRKPTPEEMAKAKALVRQGMCEGGWGLSASPFNAPGSYADTEEIIELAKEASRHGGMFHNHQRDESTYTIGLINSTLESIRVGREANMPVQITHIKAIGPDVWGKSKEVIEAINKARAEGVNITADQYPWNAASAGIQGMVFPRWAEDGGRAATLKRLEDPVLVEKIRVEGRENIRRRGGPESLLMVALGEEWTGKTIGEMGKIWNIEPVDAVIRMIKTSATGGGVVSISLNDVDVNAFMQQNWITTSSDAGANHPRLYSSYPRKFTKYTQEDKVISVQEFIRSSTGRPADFIGLDRRGYLRDGYYADVVMFDPQTFKQRNDFVRYDIPSIGVDALFVNGQLAVLDSKVTGVRAGRTIQHKPIGGSCD